MAYQTGKKTGNDTGSPGPTPAPTKTYVSPDPAQTRVFTPGYGTNSDPGASSAPQGHQRSSALADELRRVNAQSDGGDILGGIIAVGTGRSNDSGETMAPQTRHVDPTGYPAAHGMKSRQADSGSPGGTVPSKTGAVESAPVRKP